MDGVNSQCLGGVNMNQCMDRWTEARKEEDKLTHSLDEEWLTPEGLLPRLYYPKQLVSE